MKEILFVVLIICLLAAYCLSLVGLDAIHHWLLNVFDPWFDRKVMPWLENFINRIRARRAGRK